MLKSSTQTQKVYEHDSLEPLSEVKKSFQMFSLKDKIYKSGSKGGVPVLTDTAEQAVYVDEQDSHTLVIGATGSKKTRLIVMPLVRLLGWAEESMIISDPKAEIYNRAAGELEKEGYQIMVLNFRNPTLGNAWNPLSIPYRFYQRGDIDRTCEMVNDIAQNLLAADEAVKDPFWQNSAADLFFGLVLILFKFCHDNELSDMTVNISNVLKLRRELFDVPNPPQSPIWAYIKDDEIIAPALSGIVLTAKDTRAGILSTFDQKVRYFVYQPNLMDMLANDSNILEQLGERKTAIFLIMPDEKTTYHPLVSLFIKQSYEYLIYKAQLTEYGQMKTRLNYVLDEFSSLPTVKDFPAMITAARSRNIRFCLIIQSKHQLKQRYGEETETIQSNCINWIFLTSREVPLLEEISTLCGRKQDGSMPLVSVFTLQHLDKEKGQALMLCGRKRPYFAQLMDIDMYDQNEYEIRKLGADPKRMKRVELDGDQMTLKCVEKGIKRGDLLDGRHITGGFDLKPKGSRSIDFEKEPFIDHFLMLENAAINKMQEDYMEMEKGHRAYEEGDHEEAKEHFITFITNNLTNKELSEEVLGCFNNLGYMLRRGDIDEVVIRGEKYDVPKLLEEGVEKNEAFSLVNMALYVALTDEGIDWEKGELYIKKMDGNDILSIKKWWEGLAQKDELEGFVVLEWLYQCEWIIDSTLGSKEQIEDVLKNRFEVRLEY